MFKEIFFLLLLLFWPISEIIVLYTISVHKTHIYIFYKINFLLFRVEEDYTKHGQLITLCELTNLHLVKE